MPDENWLRWVGKMGLTVLSKDVAIRRKPNERRALEEARVIAFFLTSANMTGAEMAEVILRAYPRIVQRLIETKPPAIFGFGRDGRPTRL